ncbi:MAG: type VI secretion system contractile sheath small subunit [Magnetospirillum gryphiswaldense]|uniref:type VI secretion system contractile sheath small subunit n=1 Tax=Magnetospirillum sp. 64-120 TaxID=1895778 RepID=UPI0009299942|nr:type VI secretion system contractile sheath small subunit [Magnetospirillum sp. 64-120]MBI2241451.1 type VI secretion system contractile sheath small subunit [Magnetospirillum gryphiswaldense]OJX81057.1 MAG: type VI secretion system-associated protein [Magnetospirillum sp. 64-120]
MAESSQKWLLRNRPPRVKITYDVETGGAIERKELPFIMGVLADLSGKPAEALPPMKDRKFVEIDRDNFNEVLSSIKPRLTFRVPNKLVAESEDQLSVELQFSHLDDFAPVEVLKQVEPLRQLFEARERLRDLLTKLDGNDTLEDLLKQVAADPEKQEELKKLLAPASDAAE